MTDSIKNMTKDQAIVLLKLLGIKTCTKRHLQGMQDFKLTGNKDAEQLLTSLGTWDETDLQIADEFIKQV